MSMVDALKHPWLNMETDPYLPLASGLVGRVLESDTEEESAYGVDEDLSMRATFGEEDRANSEFQM
jgi:hypothetical protein